HPPPPAPPPPNYHRLLYSEIKKQFNNDGTNFEASTSYHVLVVESILWLIYFFPHLKNELLKQFNYTGAIRFILSVKTEFGIYNVGDNDGSVCINTQIDNPFLSTIKSKRTVQLYNINH
ncbi:hypothetical protein CWB56_18390, partial [Pseudoalteromonas sp. S185]|uniref:heparinase II/III family protein n=1 Tax=Pseudoalteromonas sp. S185 TaxID=2066522 RepID=UPI00127E73EB